MSKSPKPTPPVNDYKHKTKPPLIASTARPTSVTLPQKSSSTLGWIQGSALKSSPLVMTPVVREIFRKGKRLMMKIVGTVLRKKMIRRKL
jgi:hypothetical protein